MWGKAVAVSLATIPDPSPGATTSQVFAIRRCVNALIAAMKARASWWNCEDHVGSYAGFSVTRRSVGMAFRHLDDFLIRAGLERNCWRSRLLSPQLPASV